MKRLLKRSSRIPLLTLLILKCLSNIAYAQNQKKIGSTKEFKQHLKAAKSRELKTSYTDLSVEINYKSENGEELIIGSVKGRKRSSVYFKFTQEKIKDGLVTLPDQKKAYRYKTDENGDVQVSEVHIDSVMCVEYDKNATVPQSETVQSAPPASSSVYLLESYPGASGGVVLLDFDGQYIPAGSSWNGGNPIDAQAASVTEDNIIAMWKQISEDFAPFNVNITTNEAAFLATPKGKRIRCIITPTSSWYGTAGGAAYINSFTFTDNTPCFVFAIGQKNSEAGSHEIGHAMGLSHDGRTNPSEIYYGGQGNWAPIMGVSYYKPITQWSRGEYQYANQLQNDLAIISKKIPYKPDEAGNNESTSKALKINSSGAILTSNSGIITTSTDVDVYSFTTSGGNINLTVKPASLNPDLDVSLKLTNSVGTIVTIENPTTTLLATITANLTPGTYYLHIDGTGQGDPLTTGYSDYASIGQYSISGNIPVSGNQSPSVSISSPTNGTAFTAPASVIINADASDSDGSISKVEFFNGDTKLGEDLTSPYSFSWASAAAGTYSITAKAIDNTGASTTTIAQSVIVWGSSGMPANVISKAYPNPVMSTLTVDVNVEYGESVMIQLLNLQSMTEYVRQSFTANVNGVQTASIDANSIPASTAMILIVTTAHGVSTRTVIKQ